MLNAGSCSQKHVYFSFGRRVEQLNEGGQIRRKKGNTCSHIHVSFKTLKCFNATGDLKSLHQDRV